MKRILLILSIFATACLSSYGQDNTNDPNGDDVYYESDNNNAPDPAPPADANQQDAPTYQQFYDQLSPYGQWVNYPGYGYCWVPNQLPDGFSPYMTGGHWVYTDYGMTWVSDYDWGWAAFHYGRWFQDPSYGWMWEPGYDWAPSWCMWGEYNGYYCWAPIGPGAYISPHYRPDPNWWHFCDRGHIMDEHFERYSVRNEDFENHFHTSRSDINNHISYISHANTYNQGVFFAGPKTGEIERYTGHPVTKVAINNSAKAGPTHMENNKLNVYRPNIQRTTKQPVPNNAKSPQEVHPNNNNNTNRTNNNNNRVQQHNNTQQQPHENTQPQRTNTQTWTPPRQSQPKQQTQQPVQRQEQPAQQRQPERNFIPTEQPAQHYSAPVQRSAPAPSFHSSPSPGGGGGHAGGGRH